MASGGRIPPQQGLLLHLSHPRHLRLVNKPPPPSPPTSLRQKHWEIFLAMARAIDACLVHELCKEVEIFRFCSKTLLRKCSRRQDVASDQNGIIIAALMQIRWTYYLLSIWTFECPTNVQQVEKTPHLRLVRLRLPAV